MKHTLDKVPRAFNEGPFWGNASMGALLYTEQADLRFAVDHVGLWETRDHTEGALPLTFHQARAMKQPDCARASTGSFDWRSGPCRTRLPGLTLRLQGTAPITGFHAENDLRGAVTELSWARADGRESNAHIWLHAEMDVLVVELVPGSAEIVARAEGWDLDLAALEPLVAWGYHRAERQTYEQGEYVIQGFSGDRAAVLSAWRSDSLVLCTLSTGPASTAGSLARENQQRLQTMSSELQQARERHTAAWSGFWDAFDITLPDALLQQATEMELYKLFCNARPHGRPMTLQGIWNHDQAMPAWTGDWHNDLNVQACHWAAFKTNHVALTRSYIDYYADAMPHFRERAKRFVGAEDAVHIPTMMAPGGMGAGVEWSFWNSLLGPELYVAVDFCWYYDYSQDRDMLHNRIVPFLCAVARLYEKVVEERDDGCLHLPFSHSPEMFDQNGMVLTDDTTFMVSSLRFVLERLANYQELLGAGEADKAGHWRELANRLVPLSTNERGIQLWPGRDLAESHRHFSHLFPVYPLGQVSRTCQEQDAVIQAGLDRLANCGPMAYAAFSFPYRAILCARGGRGDGARLQLYNYLLGLRAPNTFCVNGDAFGTGVINSSSSSAGQSAAAFTLEAGLIVPAAVCEMLAHRAGDTLWLLPAIPSDWKEGSVRGLTLEGGHRLDLQFSDYTLSRAVLHPGCSEDLTVLIGAAAGKYQVYAGDESVEVTGEAPFVIKISKEAGSVQEIVISRKHSAESISECRTALQSRLPRAEMLRKTTPLERRPTKRMARTDESCAGSDGSREE